MVPDKFNMVDMEGIDIITSQGETVEGLYQKLVESIAQCRYQCLYNWKFNGILIPPTYVEMDIVDDVVWINEGVSVDEEDVVRIYSLEPPVPEPRLIEISIAANGNYYPPEGYDGFGYVNVSVPEPVLDLINITENGTYRPRQGVDGFSSVTVNVQSSGGLFTRIEPLHYDYIGGYVGGTSWYVGDTTSRTDIYAIEAGNIYLINLGSIIGNRFRATVFPTDPAEATSTITGTSLIATDSPVPYQVRSPLFVADSNGFLAIGKTNQSVNGIETYVSIFNVN